jgi:hypothetical protein
MADKRTGSEAFKQAALEIEGGVKRAIDYLETASRPNPRQLRVISEM